MLQYAAEILQQFQRRHHQELLLTGTQYKPEELHCSLAVRLLQPVLYPALLHITQKPEIHPQDVSVAQEVLSLLQSINCLQLYRKIMLQFAVETLQQFRQRPRQEPQLTGIQLKPEELLCYLAVRLLQLVLYPALVLIMQKQGTQLRDVSVAQEVLSLL